MNVVHYGWIRQCQSGQNHGHDVISLGDISLGTVVCVTQHLIAEHRAWIDTTLATLDIVAHEPPRATKIRPWSSVGSVETGRGRLWFKANEPALSFEAALLVVLADVAPDRIMRPLAHDATTGWFLTVDGGPLGSDQPVTVAAALDAITEVQQASARHLDEVLAAGIPDRRPDALAAVLDHAIAHPASGVGGTRCAGLRDRFVDACALLASDGRLGVVNSDHKPDHLFVGPPVRVYDWGDAVVSHPLADLPFIEREFGPAGAARLAEAWGVSLDDPLATAAAAVGHLLEADVWLRTSAEGLARHPDGIDVALTRVADTLKPTVDPP